MNRMVIGAVSALLLAAAGLFWWQGRAATEDAAPPPPVESSEPGMDPLAIPTEDGEGLAGDDLPGTDEATREERRFNRVDRDRDNVITRNEILALRVAAFRKLDADRNNLLSFEEWAVASSNRFKGADRNGDAKLTRDEFATTRPDDTVKPRCKC